MRRPMTAVLAIGVAALTLSTALGMLVTQPADKSFDDFAAGAAEQELAMAGVAGENVRCASGEDVRTFFRRDGDKFAFVGTLERADGFRVTMQGPTGRLVVNVDEGAQISGTYLAGDAMELRGEITTDGFVASDVAPVCSSYVQAVPAAPSLTPVPPTEPPAVAPDVGQVETARRNKKDEQQSAVQEPPTRDKHADDADDDDKKDRDD